MLLWKALMLCSRYLLGYPCCAMNSLLISPHLRSRDTATNPQACPHTLSIMEECDCHYESFIISKCTNGSWATASAISCRGCWVWCSRIVDLLLRYVDLVFLCYSSTIALCTEHWERAWLSADIVISYIRSLYVFEHQRSTPGQLLLWFRLGVHVLHQRLWI
ncbi:hypothetical protein F4604DRAFT_385279 [Suillus subluteus]|nr:hypothetical protein F4604DRAFT_385279 [Suillus subluteus]